MNLYNFLLSNNINQIIISECLSSLIQNYEYININENVLFYGVFLKKDYDKIKKHRGKKWILWCGNDFDISNNERLQYINNLQDIELHLYYDDKLLNNMNIMKLNFQKVNKYQNISITTFMKDIKYNIFQDIFVNIFTVFLIVHSVAVLPNVRLIRLI